jgi:hypothetical protein
MAHEHKFKALLADEVRRLVDVLPFALVGGATVSALLFQPTEGGGRLVYLDKSTEPDDPISIDPSQVSEKFIFAAEDDAPWVTSEAHVEQATLDEYFKNNRSEMRQRLAKQDRRRYPGVQFNEDGAAVAGTPYMMHHVFPSPLYHQPKAWWKRLPRLGQIYSLGKSLEHRNVLLICGISVGNRALEIRLKLLLQHENKIRRTALEIARSAASEGQVDKDEYHFLVAHLLMAHHWFYPYDPTALRIFTKLGCNPDGILKSHGWPASGLKDLAARAPLDNLIEQVAQDFSFLIYACTRWNSPEENTRRKDPAELVRELKAALRTTLALVCGKPRYLKVSGTRFEYQDEPTDQMAMEAPKELRSGGDGSPALPMLSRKQLVSKGPELLRIAEAYIGTLCPTGPSDSLVKWNSVKVGHVRGERASGSPRISMGKWLTGYARARSVMKVVEDQQRATGMARRS